ncbi:MAG: hypothetical protein ACRERX_11000 [Pseudomonas sp.]
MTTIRIGRLVAITVFVLSAWWGFTNGPVEVDRGASALQKAVGIGQIAYGITALFAIAALWFRPRLADRVAALWAVLVTVTSLNAAIAWRADLRSTLLALFAFAGTGWIVVWLVRQCMPADIVE